MNAAERCHRRTERFYRSHAENEITGLVATAERSAKFETSKIAHSASARAIPLAKVPQAATAVTLPFVTTLRHVAVPRGQRQKKLVRGKRDHKEH